MPGVSTLYLLHEVEFDATRLGAVSTQDLTFGSQVQNETASGFHFPEFPTLNAQLPTGNFTTMQIARGLGLCGLTGTSIAGLTTGFKMYLRKQAEGSTAVAGANHHKYTMLRGVVVPTTLTVDHQGDATLTYNITATYDGSNAPIVLTTSQSLPAAQEDDQRFAIGPISIESQTYDHVKSMTIDFGINVVSEGSDSEIWDRFANIREIKPTVTFTGIDPDWFSAAKTPMLGRSASFANTAWYLRKRALGNSFVADGSAVHVKFTGAGLATIDNVMQVTGQDASGLTLTMSMYYDGTNAPLVIDTASTIT